MTCTLGIPRIFALDIKGGEIVELTPEGKLKPFVKNQYKPDGIAIDTDSSRMFWTCMGGLEKQDGAIYSADLDGSNVRTVIAPGPINTPKQLILDAANKLLYFCDREGCSVFRCGYDGSNLQQIVNNKACGAETDVLGWCVGIALSPSLGKLFWTQKGTSKGGKGRLFSADIPAATDLDAVATNLQCVLDDLPEPIDLEFEEGSQTLYWTDRGALPYGQSLNEMHFETNGKMSQCGPRILARNFQETIGLKLDLSRKQIYVTDLGGSIYCYDLHDKTTKTLFTNEERGFTGVTYL